jgi:hypothetical protein
VLFFSALTKLRLEAQLPTARAPIRTCTAQRRVVSRAPAKKFRHIGAGFWIRRGAPLITWEMEQG